MRRSCWIMVVVLGLLAAMLLPTWALAETRWVETPNYKTVNLRSGPSKNDSVMVRVPYGAAVDVTFDILGSSYAHCNYNGYDGYIAWSYLVEYEPEVVQPGSRTTPKPSGGGSTTPKQSISYRNFQSTLYLAVVVPSNPSSYVNLRWAPSKDAAVQDIYYNAQTLLVISDNGQWSQVYDLENNKSGFMMNKFLRYYLPYTPDNVGVAASGE